MATFISFTAGLVRDDCSKRELDAVHDLFNFCFPMHNIRHVRCPSYTNVVVYGPLANISLVPDGLSEIFYRTLRTFTVLQQSALNNYFFSFFRCIIYLVGLLSPLKLRAYFEPTF